MKRITIYYLLVFLIFPTRVLRAQSSIYTGAYAVETKEWSRDSLRRIQYSDWKSMSTHSVDQLSNYKLGKPDAVCRYGGFLPTHFSSTGYFRVELLNGNWTIVDPDGHAFWATAVNSIRLGKSPRNEEAYQQKFKTNENWIQSTVTLLQTTGFNLAGSWSAIEDISLLNKTSSSPFSYTTQLGLLAGYIREAVKLDSNRKTHPAISFILDSSFVNYCQRKTESLKLTANDPALFGHFSDNEIAFLPAEIESVLKNTDLTNPVHRTLLAYCEKNAIQIKQINKSQKEVFLGQLAAVYFEVVSAAIKRADPNHLYLGSRLHSSAKNNPNMIRAADQFVDIHSINYYGYWEPQATHLNDWALWAKKPFFITEFYTKAEDSGLPNVSGAGWLVRTQKDRGLHYQNFCLQLLQSPSCVGWHWFRYQDNDPTDPTADPSNNDSNKGIVNTTYDGYPTLLEWMRQLNVRKYSLRNFLLKSF